MAMKAAVGGSVRRREDPRLITGKGRYTADIAREGWLYAAFVRSTIAHGRVVSVDCQAAAAMPGVAGIFRAEELGLKLQLSPTMDGFERPPLASDVVRFVGDIIAVVAAGSRGQARDAADAVVIEYEPLPAVITAADALAAGAPVLHGAKGTNEATRGEFGEAGALDGAEVVVTGHFVNQRLAAIPIEANAVAAEPDSEGGIRIWCSTQVPFRVRFEVAELLGIPDEKVHVIAPDVGGAFGGKLATYVEHSIIAAAALKLRRPVDWVEHRTENLTAMTHGRDQVQDVTLGATRAGQLVGLEASIVANGGAYPGLLGAGCALYTAQQSPGMYALPKAHIGVRVAATNTTVVSAYRGAGRPEAASLMERAMDMLAAELAVDPAELRRRNLFEGDFPYATPTGFVYDSGNYRAALEAALEASHYDQLRREQKDRRARDERLQLGIGISCHVEITAVMTPMEHAGVRIESDGSVTVQCGTTSSGQGHETALAQVASRALGVPMGKVNIVTSDTDQVTSGDGSYGSRTLQLGGSAVHGACMTVIEKAKERAADRLEASVDDIELRPEGFGVRGAPESIVSWAELAAVEPLEAEEDFFSDFTFPFGCDVAVAEVDVETGDARVVRLIAVDDCGTVLNPMLVEGQIHGGVAQGIGQALYEEFVYDSDGNPRTGTFTDYQVPTIGEIPPIETVSMETPTPNNPLGAKGVGESGTVGATAAVQNAVIDALSHLGVRHIDMPLHPMRVWEAIQAASTGR
ncbi:MAG TPA: xanthine dehydrogenase family protein molybdopterin-binding subunit [Candidatus Dormibacteraeota bacterium]|nr:xanthine dehydrogenase family protein molybdopterin-binding subunit [Candidatus Dormibacteraeota bacterium]